MYLKSIFLFFALLVPVIFLNLSCSTEARMQPVNPVSKSGPVQGYDQQTITELDLIAEIERGGAFFPGLGFYESSLREAAGDFAGAALAAYKELSFAYGFGNLTGEQVESSLRSALIAINVRAGGELEASTAEFMGAMALSGCIAFHNEDWEEAERYFSIIKEWYEEPDSFLNWIIMVIALEQAKDGNVSGYSAIRSRYTQFPEYWFRGAKAFTAMGSDPNIAVMYAEHCINIKTDGPFASPSRRILAIHSGLMPVSEIYEKLFTRGEIEDKIQRSLKENNPNHLDELLLILSLPDNPYTFFALGAMSSILPNPQFQTYFQDIVLISEGLLKDRLLYLLGN